ncbi:2Fe-2S iron-sulfur cluster-binding protein [uncultured Sphingobium sp.]|uniref:2Fe-2S iron-sulfur cluster-binding protein n=1 Tax=uncultured Sphingobium sp. TaxID=316087 RepID=UPI00262CF29D|nr:2Fe-2S iron-sulfur cluster-binding protein [uncultured Sphingobium sp.]
MISILVNPRTGAPRPLDVPKGLSLMEAIRESGIDELLALCGGCCSCATCHVYVEEGPDALKSPQGDDENDLLESSEFRKPHSRLACQLRLTQECQGLVISIAPED